MNNLEGQSPVDVEPLEDRDNWTTSKLGSIVASAMIVSEVLPLNVGAGIAVECFVHNPEAVAMFFGGTTTLTKVMGSIGSVDYLSAHPDSRFTALLSKIMSKARLSNHKTTLAVDFGIAMTAGTSAMSAVKLTQDPTSTRTFGKRYGIAMSLGVSVLFGTQSWLIAEDIQSPSLITGGAGLLGISTIFGLGRWLYQGRREDN